MGIGVKNSFRLAANFVKTADTTLAVVTGFTMNLIALQRVHIRLWLPFSLGATGGFKFQWVVPASPGNIISTFRVQDTVTPAVIVGIQTTSTAFSNALAVAGTHWCESEVDYVNGSVAGAISFQAACLSAAGVMTALQGGFMDVTIGS